MHRLVCSGVMVPGQSSRQLLDSIDLGVLLHFAYGMLVENADAKEKKKFDEMLDSLELQAADEQRTITKKLASGKVVEISEARLARIRANQGGMSKMTRKR